jgi:hypothetical protein
LTTFADTFLMFKTSHLGVSNFSFLSLFPFRTENLNKMSILLQNYMSFWKWYSYGVRGKIEITKDFLYRMSKVRENQSLIYLSERF